MKKFLFLFATLSLFTSAAWSQCKVTVKWSFKNVEEGFDHDNKIKVWVDEELIGESTVTKETTPNSYKFTVKPGSRHLRIVNFALYEGNWEEHTIDNQYSQDCLYDETLNFGKKKKITLVFDIDSGTIAKVK